MIDIPITEPGELWAQFPDIDSELEGRYLLSSLGRVYHIRLKRLIKPSFYHNRLQVYLAYEHKQIARCVLTAFDCRKSLGWVPFHTDGDPRNCRISNLRWQPRGLLVSAGRNRTSKISTGDVIDIRKRYAEGETAKTIGECYGVSVDYVRGVALGKFRVYEPGIISKGNERLRPIPKSAKLTPELVRQIRRLANEGTILKYIAKEFGINESTVRKVVKRESWKHIP